MDMNKRFVFLMGTTDFRVEWSGNETAEDLITRRFPPNNAMHNSVKRFCERAKAGDFLHTTYNFIFCCDDGERVQNCPTDTVSHKKTVYIAGKITGLEYQEAFNKFECAEDILRSQGYEPINPMKKVSAQANKTWSEYMCEDMPHLFSCDAIYLLPDWYESKGARVEFAVAKELGLTILFAVNEDFHNNKNWANEWLRINDATFDLWQNSIGVDGTQTILDAINKLRKERNQYAEENQKLREVISSRDELF